MSKWEHVQTAMWSDPDFEELSPQATLLYIWSFTNSLCNVAGLYRVSRRKMLEAKVERAELDSALTELARGRFVYYEDGLLWVRSRVKYLHTSGPNHARSIRRDLELLPENHPLVQAFLFTYHDVGWLRDLLGEFGVPEHDPLLSIIRSDDVGSSDRESLLRVSSDSLESPYSLDIDVAVDPALSSTSSLSEKVVSIVGIFARFGHQIDPVSVENAIARFPSVDHEGLARGCAEDLKTGEARPVGRTYHRWLENDARRDAETREREQHKPTAGGMVSGRDTCLDCSVPIKVGVRCRGCDRKLEERNTKGAAA